MTRKKKNEPRASTSHLDQARNDLFGHIHRCGVLQATEEQQVEWMDDTVEYIGECYPSLTPEELEQLKQIGLRFCRPAIPHGAGKDARDGEGETAAEEASAA